MKLILLCASLLLVGCQGYTTSEDIQTAYKACENNGGLSWLGNSGMSESAMTEFRCKNGLTTTVGEYNKRMGVE
jgi:hypothetical protein